MWNFLLFSVFPWNKVKRRLYLFITLFVIEYEKLYLFFFQSSCVFFTSVYKSSHFYFIDYFGTLHFSIRRRKRKMSTSFAQRSGVIKSAKKLRFCTWNFLLLCLLQKQSKLSGCQWMLLWILSDLNRQNLFQIFSHKLV